MNSASPSPLSAVPSTTAPAAPYPSDTRAKGWPFQLDYERIEQSDTWALATSEMRPWLLMVWMTSWKQAPCGSLPANDELIAARIGMDIRQFGAHRDILLRGWYLADDGRLYHPVISEQVERMLSSRNAGSYRRFRSLVLSRDGAMCAYCGATDTPLQLDHIMPRSRGGADDPDNLTPACRTCNASKGARTPEEWRASR